MPDTSSFGQLLRSFRMRLGYPRHRIEWLSERLSYAPSTLYGWETDDESKGLPSRSTILAIARLYSLSADEANQLIGACKARRKRPALAAQYRPLSAEELSRWNAVPSITTPLLQLRVLHSQTQAAREAYLIGELHTARLLAESALTQAPVSHVSVNEPSSEPSSELAGEYTEWTHNDLDVACHIWMSAWQTYFEASALLETPQEHAALCAPYLGVSRRVAAFSRDTRLKALALHIEGDLHHAQNHHATAMRFHLAAMERLESASGDPALAAMIQRLIILDGVHVLAPDQFAHHVRVGRDMLEHLPLDDRRPRTLLCEAAGRALGVLGDPDCWGMLAEAERFGRYTFPVGYVTALYSHMVALAASSRSPDLDQLEAVGAYALSASVHRGWQRRVEQIIRAAAACNVRLEAPLPP